MISLSQRLRSASIHHQLSGSRGNILKFEHSHTSKLLDEAAARIDELEAERETQRANTLIWVFVGIFVVIVAHFAGLASC